MGASEFPTKSMVRSSLMKVERLSVAVVADQVDGVEEQPGDSDGCSLVASSLE